ncbi:uncharacterized protein [Typha angustifolia]|uniref:uncharacterized protein isoform X1 n=2 Tax=Typha angustifolia TaxID=59011 RepID=UPI003C2D5E99
MGSLPTDPSDRKLCVCNLLPAAIVICIILFGGSAFVLFADNEKIPAWLVANFGEMNQTAQSHICESQCKPVGSELLPEGIISLTSDLEMEPLLRIPERKGSEKPSKSLLAIPVGIKQKEVVNKIVSKFPSANFTVMLFHYDGIVDKWRDLQWSDTALHVSAISQTKWWFAKRFLHPNIVADYNYIFLWDEDLDVENFHPLRYLSIVEREGLQISQPALDSERSEVHFLITARLKEGDVHRRTYKLKGGEICSEYTTAPPCAGWVEMMAPVFSGAAWHCVWHMIQNDLVIGWGLDYKFGYCAQGDRGLNIGVVDSEYIVHEGIPSLGGHGDNKAPPGSATSNDQARQAMKKRSYAELDIFTKRWQHAVVKDKCWTDPYPE